MEWGLNTNAPARFCGFFAVFGGMNASASLGAGMEKLKAQSSKLKKSSKAKAQTRPCRSHAVRRVSFVPLSLFILLSFELWTLSFDQFIPPKTAGNRSAQVTENSSNNHRALVGLGPARLGCRWGGWLAVRVLEVER